MNCLNFSKSLIEVSCRICNGADLHPTFSLMTSVENNFHQTRNISEKNFLQNKRNPLQGADYYVIEYNFFGAYELIIQTLAPWAGIDTEGKPFYRTDLIAGNLRASRLIPLPVKAFL